MVSVFATQYKEDANPRCRLCGCDAPLTFEHIPPRRCFNNSPVLLRTIRGLVNQFKTLEPFRRGMGVKSLCEACNGWTASQYGSAFADFTRTAMGILDRLPQDAKPVFVPFTCHALGVAKQLAVMAIALSGTYTLRNAAFNRLRNLVLSPRLIGRPYGLEFWTYFMRDGNPRMTQMGLPFAPGGEMPFVWCEVARPPLGYVVTGSGSDEFRIADRLGLCNLNAFFERPHSWIDTMFLRIPILRPVGGASLQYAGYDDEFLF